MTPMSNLLYDCMQGPRHGSTGPLHAMSIMEHHRLEGQPGNTVREFGCATSVPPKAHFDLVPAVEKRVVSVVSDVSVWLRWTSIVLRVYE